MPIMSGRRWHVVRIAALAVFAGLIFPAAAWAANVAGVWATAENKSHIEVTACADDESKLCGKIVWLKEPLNKDGEPKTDRNNPEENLRERPILGLPLLAAFEKTEDPTVWEEGKVYNPEDGEIYSCVMTLQANGTLGVRGYVGLPIFGKSQEWTRVK
jgi:uncharacterized protein (DUF2147 family)